MGWDLLFKNGLVYDGRGKAAIEGDVAVEGDRIAAVGELGASSAQKTIDVRGRAICPGFIDTHTHSEFTLLADPRAEGKIRQGVTTEISGNCGLSGGPLLGAYAERRETDLREFDIRERWESLGEFLRLLEGRRPAVNYATLVGHGNIRAAVTGYEDRPADPKETARMGGLLGRALEEGGIGLSTGLIYPPGVYSGLDEIVALAEVTAAHGGLYATHMRSEGAGLVESIGETLEIAARAGIGAHISHLKTAGKENWQKLDTVLDLIADAHRDGLRVTADRYPYLASSTDLDTVLPAWVFEGGSGAELDRLSDPSILARIRAELGENLEDAAFWDAIRVSTVQKESLRWMQGRSMTEIARAEGRAPFETLIFILLEDRLRTSAIFFGMSEENLVRILKQRYTMLGSDASARCFEGPTAAGKPHPRAFGTFPGFLSRYVREKQVMEFPEAIRRLTSLPARTFGLAGRGILKAGFAADLVVFDPGKVQDHATFEDPFGLPGGIDFVVVNGVPAIVEGKPTGDRAGRVLRRGQGGGDS